MKKEDLHKEVTAHLEFLGYDIEDLKPESGHTYLATSEQKPTLFIRVFNNTTILSTHYNGLQLKALKSVDFFEALNTINQASMSKWYYEKQDDDVAIVTEADFYGYEKASFGKFVDNLLQEVTSNIGSFTKFTKE